MKYRKPPCAFNPPPSGTIRPNITVKASKATPNIRAPLPATSFGTSSSAIPKRRTWSSTLAPAAAQPSTSPATSTVGARLRHPSNAKRYFPRRCPQAPPRAHRQSRLCLHRSALFHTPGLWARSATSESSTHRGRSITTRWSKSSARSTECSSLEAAWPFT